MTEQATHAQIDAAVDAIEGAYEYFLAYAAQGRKTDSDLSPEHGPRSHLQAMIAALAALPALARGVVASDAPEQLQDCGAFFDALGRDAQVAEAAARLVLAQQDIGSQLIDNLNASIHLRAVLTDIFLIDEILKARS